MTDTQTATSDMAGRTCPYCFSPVKEGGSVRECHACSAVHHSDCWGENGGCAVTSCAAGPAQGARPQPQPDNGGDGPVKPGSERPRRRRVGRIAAAAAVVMLLGGGAAALAIAGGDGSSSSSYVDTYTSPDPQPEPEPTETYWSGEGTDDLTGNTADIELDVNSLDGGDDGRLDEWWASGDVCGGTLTFAYRDGSTAVFDFVADSVDCLDSTVYLTPQADGTLEFVETWSDTDGDHELWATLE